MTMLKKYELTGNHDNTFFYRLLSRLLSDCRYYLGNGGRYAGALWTKNERDHLELMREIYAILPESPEWLTLEEIDALEREILGTC